MWQQRPTDTFKKRVGKWPKKHSRELGAMLSNLQIVFDSLRQGATVESIQFGFIHREPGGVIAVDQQGGGAGLKETRLYVFVDKPSETLHLITAGDKRSQAEDIAYAKAFADEVKEGCDDGSNRP